MAERLTREPAAVSEEDIERLRGLGLDDRGIFDAVHVVAYYNYVNRLAEGLGIELEPWWSDTEGPDRFRSASVDGD